MIMQECLSSRYDPGALGVPAVVGWLLRCARNQIETSAVAMNFFEHQDVAQRKTKWLVYAYIFTVILIVVSVDTVALLVLQASQKARGRPGELMEMQVPALLGITGGI